MIIQKAKDSNVILKWYYIHLIHFLNEEDGSASADNEKNLKNSEKKALQQKTKILVKNQQVLRKADCQH